MDVSHLFKKRNNLPFELYEIDLFNATDDELLGISKQMGLALSLDEMKMIKDYFKNKGRLPTDIELQALGQAWSEHCCYKSSKYPLKQFIYDIAREKIVAREDAGVVEFDDGHYYVAALESHNHPSAVEPYGGAATGIGGIVRDVVCMGAQPVVFIDPLFFGPLEYPYERLPKGVKHPRYLLRGVVSGIRDYGNRIGIPTACGQVYFHEKYVGNCLVNVGCIGIAKKDKLVHSRAKAPGNIYVYVGGKTGRDGIHGVTFASAELTEESEESSISAVQLGDPITKEPLIHATLECNEKGLLEGLKDFGGGGLSCVSGELAYEAGYGAEIHLDNVPLKEENMAPWEIWVSESQERMMFLVNEENLDKVLHICKKWDVFATPVGRVIKEPVIRTFYKGEKILEMDISFQVGGPVYDSCKRPYTTPKKKIVDEDFEMPDLNEILLKLLSSPNIACKGWVIRQYDHEVRGNTIIKPLQGKIGGESHGDAAVIKPLEDSYKGLAITSDINPSFTEIDPYLGACSAVDEVCRNLVAVGARPDSLTDCLNFGNPEKPERMGEFYEACRGLRDVARKLNLPFISGNVSFYNEAQGISIPPTPTLVGIGIIEDIRKCVTSDIKSEGNMLYLIGRETKREMGGSEYYKLIKRSSSIVPGVEIDLLKRSIDCILELTDKGLLKSCHDVSEGGIGVCISEMLIGGNIGAKIDLSRVSPGLRSDFKLFSESNTRWVVEIEKKDVKRFENIVKKHDLLLYKIGYVEGERLEIIDGVKKVIDLGVSEITEKWHDYMWDVMG